MYRPHSLDGGRRTTPPRPALFAVHPTSSHPRPPTSAQLSHQPLTHVCRSANTYEESRPSKGVFLCVWLAQTAMGLTGVSRRGGVLFSAIAATAVLPKIPHSNCSKRVPNRPLRPRRGRFGTLLELLQCGIFGRTAVYDAIVSGEVGNSSTS